MLKRLVIVIFIMFGAFLSFSLYRTFAYDTSVVEETPSTTDLEYTFKIGNSSIKQITVDSGETKYYDVVLGNPNPAKISYGVYYEMVSPSTKPDGFSIEYTSKSTGESTGKVGKEGNITLNLVVTNTSSSSVTVKLGTVAGYVNGGDLELSSNQEFIPKKKFPKATELVESLNDNSTGDSGSGVYKVHHDAIPASSSATGEIIEATDDYRYYGASPNNYICLDNSTGTCEDRHLYRIIGSMREDSDGTYKVKVVKATPLTDGTTSEFSYDCKGSGSSVKLLASEISSCIISECDDSTYVWHSSSQDSSLMQLLNGMWMNDKMGSIFNNSSITTNINFSNFGLSVSAKKSINNGSRYYLGGMSSSYNRLSELVYIEERSIRSGNINSNYWEGIVGLIYLSDYGYASGNKCYNDICLDNNSAECVSSNWLHNNNYIWTISISSSNYTVMAISSSGNAYSGCTYETYKVYPSFYLTSNTLISGGDGSLNNPYTITLE